MSGESHVINQGSGSIDTGRLGHPVDLNDRAILDSVKTVTDPLSSPRSNLLFQLLQSFPADWSAGISVRSVGVESEAGPDDGPPEAADRGAAG